MTTSGALVGNMMRGARSGRKRVRDNRGQSLVEFAFAAIVFFMMVFGIIEFGITVWRYNMVADLAQEGARWASVRGSDSDAPASAADVRTFVISRAVGIPVTVTTTPAPSTLAAGATVTVVVQTTYTPLTQLLPQTTMNLQSTARMIMSR
jgi:Flp pilus assembly protein TadG